MNTLSYRIEAMIRRPPEDVFDYCSDLRSELQWNKYVEKLSDGPVGVGTRYRARWANSGPTTVEVVQFDRPRRWETTTRARGMSIRFRGTVTDAAQGARYTANLALHPKGLAWLLTPLALLAMRRQDQQNMHRVREALESKHGGRGGAMSKESPPPSRRRAAMPSSTASGRPGAPPATSSDRRWPATSSCPRPRR